MATGEKAFNLLSKVKEYFSRKFLLAVACLWLGFYLINHNKDVADWAMLVGVVLTFYNGANVAERFAELKSDKMLLQQREVMQHGKSN